LLGKSIKQAASLSSPDFKRQLPQINGILNAAKKDTIPADPMVIKDLHDKLLPLVKQNDPEAWLATLSLASYRTAFNSDPTLSFMVKPLTGLPKTETIDYDIPVPHGEVKPDVSAALLLVAKGTGAAFERIDTDMNTDKSGTNAYITLRGGGVVLDGRRIRNAVLIGVHVV